MDFDPLVSEKVFYRVQGILNGRVRVIAPRVRNRTEFPLRGFVRCVRCGRPLTGSWSKGRNDRFAYYHCHAGECRAVNIAKAKLEGLFVEELERLQPTQGYMRLVKESVLKAWNDRRAEIRDRAVTVERHVKSIQQKLSRPEETFIFDRTIDIDTYDRQKDRLREELTLAQIDRHATELEEIDVEGILAFAERVLPRAAGLWVQASLEQRQRFQLLFFPGGIAFDGNGFVGTAVTAPAFSYLRPIEGGNESLVDQIFPRWNPLTSWMRQIEDFQRAA